MFVGEHDFRNFCRMDVARSLHARRGRHESPPETAQHMMMHGRHMPQKKKSDFGTKESAESVGLVGRCLARQCELHSAGIAAQW